MHALIKYNGLQVAVISAVTIERITDHTFFLWAGEPRKGPEIGLLAVNKDFDIEFVKGEKA